VRIATAQTIEPLSQNGDRKTNTELNEEDFERHDAAPFRVFDVRD